MIPTTLLKTRMGASLMMKVPLTSFRLSSGCRLELIFAMTPTSSSVAEERIRACSTGAWPAGYKGSTVGALSATASERVEGSFDMRPTAMGKASEASK